MPDYFWWVPNATPEEKHSQYSIFMWLQHVSTGIYLRENLIVQRIVTTEMEKRIP